MRSRWLVIAAIVGGSASASAAFAAQDERTAAVPPLPRFKDYPVARSTFRVPLVLKKGTPDWSYRTRYRAADRETADFSANGIIVLWGCGTQCVTGSWIDRTIGKIRGLPVAGEEYLELDFTSRAGSNLILSTWLDPEAPKPVCLFGAHVWNGRVFRPVRGYPVRAAGRCPVSYLYR